MAWEYNDNEFVKIFRKILDWEWYSDPCTRDVFIHCLLKANWKPGTWKGYKYDRGQFITSLPSLSKELGFSERKIRTALKHLVNTGEIADWHDNKVRVITVLRYDDYQTQKKREKRQANGQASDRQNRQKTSGVEGGTCQANDTQTGSQVTGNRQASDRQVTADIRSKEGNTNVLPRKKEEKNMPAALSSFSSDAGEEKESEVKWELPDIDLEEYHRRKNQRHGNL